MTGSSKQEPRIFSGRCHIIGVLDNGMQGLAAAELQLVRQAELVIAGRRTMQLFNNDFRADAERMDLTGQLTRLPETIKTALKQNRRVIVLATGDPLCHGIGAFLSKKIPHDLLQIHPNLSMVQVAFSRLGKAWQTARICSVHTADAGEWTIDSGMEHGLYGLLTDIVQHDLLAVYTSPDNSPERIANMMQLENLAEQFELSVFECLLQSGERINTGLSVKEVAEGHYKQPNLLVIERIKPPIVQPLFGYEDHFYEQRKPDKGLITRRDIRAVVLAKMQLNKKSIVWDIGAGSGSVGLEAASLCEQGYVFAIEKNCNDLALIHNNRKKMQLHNYSIECAKAPEKMAHWPEPDAVFIGGSAGQLEAVIELVCDKIKTNGVLVMNFITLENLHEALDIMKKYGFSWQLTQIQAAHSQPILNMNRLQADNPVWIVSATIGENKQ